MFWFVMLPFSITLAAMVVAVTIVTIWAPATWNRQLTLFISTVLAAIAFIPSCTGIMVVTDNFRFGHFEYPGFEDVNDPRVEFYLPTKATHIEMVKHANGNRARYTISEEDFMTYVDDLWKHYGKQSVAPRDRIADEGTPADPVDFSQFFAEQDWPPLQNAVIYHSPAEGDGGGATYFFDAGAGMAYQWTCYW